MNFKKFISGVSALAIAASAFAGLAVTASAADVPLYSENFESMTTETITGLYTATAGANYQTNNTIETDSTNYLKAYGPSDRDRRVNFIFDTIAADSLTGGKATISFRTRLASGNNAGTSNGRTGNSTIYVLPDGEAQSPKNGAAPTDYLFALKVTSTSDSANKSTIVSRKVLLLSGSEDVVLCDTDSSDYGITASKSSVSTTNWIKVSADVNFNTGYADVTINDKSAGTVKLASSKTGFIGFGALTGAKAYGYVALDDISITTADPDDVTTADYLVNYQLGDKIVKTVTVKDAEVESTPVADMGVFSENGQKYFCVENDAEGKTVAEDGTTTVTVTVREAETYAVNVTASTGEALASKDVVEGDSYTYAYPKYFVNEAGKLVACDESTYSVTITPTESQNITVPYTVQDTKVFQFVEMSDTTDPAAYPHAVSNAKFQNIGTTETNVLTVAKSGIYTVEFIMGSRNAANASNTLTLKVNGEKLTEQATAAYSPVYTVEDVQLKAGDVISAVGNNARISLDYVLLTKTGEIPATAAAELVEDFTSDENAEDQDPASLWELTITAGTTPIEKVDATVNGVASDGAKTLETPITTGNVVFGLVINKASAAITSIDAIVNDDTVNAELKK